MKNKNLKTVSLSFVMGAIVGVSILAFSGFTTQNQSSQGAPSTINTQEANGLFKTYYGRTVPMNQKLKGMTIGMEQFNAMQGLMGGGVTPIGFRIYFGENESGSKYGIVVGINGEGKDMTENVYQTNQGMMGSCPNVCDINSPITAQ